jgi:hypothetical protein
MLPYSAALLNIADIALVTVGASCIAPPSASPAIAVIVAGVREAAGVASVAFIPSITVRVDLAVANIVFNDIPGPKE